MDKNLRVLLCAMAALAVLALLAGCGTMQERSDQSASIGEMTVLGIDKIDLNDWKAVGLSRAFRYNLSKRSSVLSRFADIGIVSAPFAVAPAAHALGAVGMHYGYGTLTEVPKVIMPDEVAETTWLFKQPPREVIVNFSGAGGYPHGNEAEAAAEQSGTWAEGMYFNFYKSAEEPDDSEANSGFTEPTNVPTAPPEIVVQPTPVPQ